LVIFKTFAKIFFFFFLQQAFYGLDCKFDGCSEAIWIVNVPDHDIFID